MNLESVPVSRDTECKNPNWVVTMRMVLQRSPYEICDDLVRKKQIIIQCYILTALYTAHLGEGTGIGKKHMTSEHL
jgi:hypothetical protein